MADLEKAIIALADWVGRQAAATEEVGRLLAEQNRLLAEQNDSNKELARSVVAQSTATSQLSHIMRTVASDLTSIKSKTDYIAANTKRRKLAMVK